MGRILGRDPLPSTREVFSEVRREESRRQVMLRPGASDASPTQPEMSAMVTSKPDFNNRFSKKSDRPICEHCNKVGHIKAKCWKLHGKPADSQRSFNDNKSALQVSQPTPSSPRTQPSTPEQSFFNKDNLKQLFKLWTSHQSSIPSSSLAQKGIHMTALKISLDNSNPWILDSGASNHMNGSSYMFHTYYPCLGHEKVKIAYGSLSAIDGKGSIILSSSITLSNVLHVPNLAYNLLYVHKLTTDSQCKLIFVPTDCDFQAYARGR